MGAKLGGTSLAEIFKNRVHYYSNGPERHDTSAKSCHVRAQIVANLEKKKSYPHLHLNINSLSYANLKN